MFDTNLLRSFVQVVETGSITGAAERLNLTQSAVSSQIRKLEAQAKCAVIERTTRSLRVTVQGELLLEYARKILALNEQAMFQIGSSKNLSGTIKIGCSEGFVANWLFPIVSSFSKSHPEINIQLCLGITTELHAAARKGDLDIVIGAICEDVKGARLLWSEPLFWAFAVNMEPDWKKSVPLALFPEPCPYRKAATTSLENAGLQWRLTCTSPSVAGVQAAARAGLAVTPLTRSGLSQGVRALPANAPLPSLPDANFAIVLPDKPCPPPVRKLVSSIENSTFGTDTPL